MKAIQMLWDESVKLGMLKSAPNVEILFGLKLLLWTKYKKPRKLNRNEYHF